MIEKECLREIVRIEQLYIRGSGCYELENFNLLIGAGQLVFLCEPEGFGAEALAGVFLGRRSIFSGKLFLEGRQLVPQKELSYEKEGIYVISEDESMQPYMSVEENLFLSWKPHLFLPWFMKRSLRALSGRLLKRLDISIHPGTLVKELSFEDRQLLKLARAYCKGAKLIVINGVFDVISGKRQQQLMDLVERLRREKIAVLCISHKFLELAALGDMLVLIKNGTKIWTMLKPKINIRQAGRIYNSKITGFERAALSGQGKLFMEIYRDGQRIFAARGGRCIGICAQEWSTLKTFMALLTGERVLPGTEIFISADSETGGHAFGSIRHLLRGVKAPMQASGALTKRKLFCPRSYEDCVKQGIVKADIQFLENNFSGNLSIEENIYLPDMKKMRVYGLLKNIRYERFLQKEYTALKREEKEISMPGQSLWDMLFLRLIYGSMRMILFAGTLPANFKDASKTYIQKLVDRDKILVFLSVNEQELKMFCHEFYHCEHLLP